MDLSSGLQTDKHAFQRVSLAASTGQNNAFWQCLYPRWMQPAQAAKSKAMTIGTVAKFVAITTPLSLPRTFAVPLAVNLPKESLSLMVFSCGITNIPPLNTGRSNQKQLHICWRHAYNVCRRYGRVSSFISTLTK